MSAALAPVLEFPEDRRGFCECGNAKSLPASCCSRCRSMEAQRERESHPVYAHLLEHGTATVGQIAEVTGMKYHTVGSWLIRAALRGDVARVSGGMGKGGLTWGVAGVGR